MKTRFSHLNQKYNEEVEVGHSPELLKHILGDEVPKRVLKEDMKRSGSDWTIFKSTVFPNSGDGVQRVFCSTITKEAVPTLDPVCGSDMLFLAFFSL